MLMPVETMQGEDEEDTQLLKEMAERARDYVTSFNWCPPIVGEWLADGVGGIIAIFLFKFTYKIAGTDDRLWVVVGDLPSAYMVVEPDDSGREALERYCLLMDDWVTAVRDGGDFKDVFPITAARTEEHARMLESRLTTLREDIIPEFSAEHVTDANGDVIT